MPLPARRFVNPVELDAAREIVRMTIRLQRQPTPLELWPVLKAAAPNSRHLKTLRSKSRVAENGETGCDWGVVASHSLVRKRADQLLRSHAELLQAESDIKQMRQEIGRVCFRTLYDCLERGGPYDHNAKLVDAKMKGALAAIRLAGHSLEETQPQTQVNVNVLPPGEEEARRIRVEREKLYRAQLAAREGRVLEMDEAEYEVAEASP